MGLARFSARQGLAAWLLASNAVARDLFFGYPPGLKKSLGSLALSSAGTVVSAGPVGTLAATLGGLSLSGAGTVSGSATFDPGTLTLTFWERGSYSGSPWSGTASAGSSGTRSLTEGTNPPATGTAVNGYTPASFDGTNDVLTSSSTVAQLFTAGAGTVILLVNAGTTGSPPANPWDGDNIIADTGDWVGVEFSTSGARGWIDDGGGAKAATVACSTGAWHAIMLRWNGTTVGTTVDMGTEATVSGGNVGATSGTVRVGVNGTFGQFWPGQILEVMTLASYASNTDYQNVVSYFQDRYGLDLGLSTGRTGTLSATIGTVALSSAGVVQVVGAASPAIDSLAISSAGAVQVVGSSALAIGDLSLSSAGTTGTSVSGELAAAIGDLVLSSAGTSLAQGLLVATLGALGLSGAGVVPVVGAMASTLGALSVSSDGSALVHGSLASALSEISLSSDGAARVSGAASVPLGQLSISSAGSAAVVGSLAATLGALELSSAVVAPIAGSMEASMGGLGLASAGEIGAAAFGSLSATLGDVAVSSAGAALVRGALASSVDGISLASSASARAAATAAVQLGGVDVASHGASLVSGMCAATIGNIDVVSTGGAVGDASISGALSLVIGDIEIAARATAWYLPSDDIAIASVSASSLASAAIPASTCVAVASPETAAAAAAAVSASRCCVAYADSAYFADVIQFPAYYAALLAAPSRAVIPTTITRATLQ